jgi:methyltransferase (TIGR00027 family)
VAWGRAAESRRPDRLFDDPLAAAVVERGQRELAVMFGVDEDDPVTRSLVNEQVTSTMLEHIAVRTRYFDDRLLEACAAGCRQVVILAAGMDARVFRLPWPAGTRLYELDRPEVLAYKEEVVAAEGVLPRCERRIIAVDLTADWATPLRAAGFEGDQQTAWLAEGLLSYLTAEENDTLIHTVGRLSRPGSTLTLQVSHPSAISEGPLAAFVDRLASFGAPVRFGVDDPVAWLAGHGWRARVDNPSDVAVRYGRRMIEWQGAGSADKPTGWFVTTVGRCEQ